MTEAKQSIGIYGGSFDPPHIAHVLAALYAIQTAGLSRVIVVPCFNHPFLKKSTSYEHRVNMCRLAFRHLGDYIEISEIEKELGRTSYTIDTLNALSEKYPDAEFHLIIGTDILPETPQWKSFDKISEKAKLLLLPRPVSDEIIKKVPAEYLMLLEKTQCVMPDISATDIRERLLSRKSTEGLLSKNVREYIEKNELYR